MTALVTHAHTPASQGVNRPATALRVGAQAAGVSAAIHLWLAPGHMREWWLYGVFFLAAGMAEALLAALLLRRASLLILLGGIWGNVALIATYVASRTVGLPLTPPHGGAGHVPTHLPVAGGIGNGIPVYPGGTTESHVESVGLLDLPALAAELLLVAVLIGLLPARLRLVSINVLLAASVSLWVLRAVIALT